MPSTRDIRRRIKSVKNTKQITKAMELVAASKMKRAQNDALAGIEYSHLLTRMLASVQGKIPEKFTHPFLEKREVRKRGILLLTTDKGLCGPLNGNLFRKVTEMSRETEFVVVGRKGTQFISRTHRNLIADFNLPDRVTFSQVRPIAEFLMERFVEGNIDTIEVLYPRFVNTLTQEATLFPLLPLHNLASVLETLRKQRVAGKEVGANVPPEAREMIFEPSPMEVLSALLPRFISQQIYHFALDAKASEQSARMVAMKTASDNASNLLEDLTLDYNKARQAAITQEILEISAAALSK